MCTLYRARITIGVSNSASGFPRLTERLTMTDLKAAVGQRLKQCRSDQGLTIEQTAQRLTERSGERVIPSRYSNWETGLRMPPPDMLIKMGELFGVAPGWLQGFTPHSSANMTLADYITANTPQLSTKNGIVQVKQASDATAFNLEYLKQRGLNRNRLLAIRQIDASMSGMIEEGDEVLIDQTRTDVDGQDLYAIVAPSGAIWVRWISSQLDGTFKLSAQNAERYPEQVLDRDAFERLTIVGRIARIAHDR